MKRAVVTGGAGFIGSHLVDSLSEKGYELLVIDDLSSGSEANLSGARARTSVELVKEDISSQAAAKALITFKPDVVLHHAAQMNVRRSVTEPSFDADKNVLGTVNMLEAARIAGVEKFIFSSTGGAIYGEQESFPATEEHRIMPESPYGVSKRCAELYLDYYSRKSSMKITILRYGNVYGPRQNPKGEAGVVAIFTQNIIAGKPLKVNGDGQQTRDFVFVGDVVKANLAALESSQSNSFVIYNIGLGLETSVLDIVSAMKKAWIELGKTSDVEVVFGDQLQGEQKRSVIDPKKISTELGWQPKVDLTQGIKLTIESFL
jgi:UDP-glucose 4-epimerase